MKKIILGIVLALLFVSCGNDFKSYYKKEKIERYFAKDDIEFKKNFMILKKDYGIYTFYIFDKQEEVDTLRKKINDEMSVKGIANITSSKTMAIYSNLRDYTVTFSEVRGKSVPVGKIGVMVAETEISFLDERNFDYFKEYIFLINERLKLSLE